MYQRRFSRISAEKWNSCPMVNGKRPEGEPANARRCVSVGKDEATSRASSHFAGRC